MDQQLNVANNGVQPPDIVIFDGQCHLCARSVQFILRHESGPHFLFSALQSPAGAQLLTSHGFQADGIASFVLISGGKAYTRSAAALRTVRHFKGPWRMLGALWLVPRPLRDLAYDYVAKRRYRWFGKADECMVPTPDLTARFLA